MSDLIYNYSRRLELESLVSMAVKNDISGMHDYIQKEVSFYAKYFTKEQKKILKENGYVV
jgi:hypothetical protein